MSKTENRKYKWYVVIPFTHNSEVEAKVVAKDVSEKTGFTVNVLKLPEGKYINDIEKVFE